MRILLLNQTFHPDHMATGQYLTEVALALAEQGHAVTVVTSNRAYDDPQKRFTNRETWRGIDICRVSSTSFGKTAKWRRAADFASFILSCLWRLLFLRRHDVVVALTTPPLISFIGACLAWVRGSRFVYWVMDMNPDEAIAAGWLREGSLAARVLEWMSRFSFRHAHRIIALDRFMADRIRAKGIGGLEVEGFRSLGGGEHGAESGEREGEKLKVESGKLKFGKTQRLGVEGFRSLGGGSGEHGAESRGTEDGGRKTVDGGETEGGGQRTEGGTAEDGTSASELSTPPSVDSGFRSPNASLSPELSTLNYKLSTTTPHCPPPTAHCPPPPKLSTPRLVVVPPWSHDSEVFFDSAGRERFRKAHGLENQFVVMYSGNHSPVHPLKTLLEAAEQLSAEQDIKFAFVGGGSEWRNIQKRLEVEGFRSLGDGSKEHGAGSGEPEGEKLKAESGKLKFGKTEGGTAEGGGRKTVDGGRKTVDGGRKMVDGGRRTVDGPSASELSTPPSVDSGFRSPSSSLCPELSTLNSKLSTTEEQEVAEGAEREELKAESGKRKSGEAGSGELGAKIGDRTLNSQQSTLNFLCLPYQPLSELSGSLSAADLHVVVMGDAMLGLVHPCKIYNILNIGTPILYIGPSPSHVTEIFESGEGDMGPGTPREGTRPTQGGANGKARSFKRVAHGDVAGVVEYVMAVKRRGDLEKLKAESGKLKLGTAEGGEQGAKSWERGARSEGQGAGTWERGAGSGEHGAGSAERGARSEEQGAGSAERGARSGVPQFSKDTLLPKLVAAIIDPS